MSAASVTVLRGIPVMYITAIATAIHTGTPELAMRADRMGNSISITTMTTSMDMRRSLRKLHTLVPTTWGWSLTRVMSTPSGSVLLYS